MKIEIKKIKVKERRKLNDLTTIKNSIKEIGLLNPITISDTNELIAGGHRLQACIELGYTHIECNILNLDDDLNGLKQELAEIDENLIRNNGTVLEQIDWLKRSKKIYETLYPETKWGHKKKEDNLSSFIEDTAERTGLNKRTISRKTSIDITPEVKEIIQDLPISNNQSELQKLTKETPTKQLEIAEKMKGGVKSVKEAKKKIEIETRKETATKVIDNSFEYNKLFNGNSIEILKTFPDNIVDCVMMDPPWGVEYEEDGRRETHNPKFNDTAEYAFKVLDDVCKELKRVCKSNAHIYCVFGMDNYQRFYDILSKYFTIEKQPLIWVKNNHTLRDFSQGYAFQYEPIFFGTDRTRLLNNSISRNILNFDIPRNKIHKAQKPIELLEYLIANSTVEGEVVIDPFMGSGSSLKAAKNINRKYIGIEMDVDSYNAATEYVGKDEKIDDFWNE